MNTPGSLPPRTLTPQRLAEIKLFHRTLTRRLEADEAAISGFERIMLVDIMAELIEHADTTT
ncbi:hypothetical protein ACH9DO_08955 [Kocuria sp. M1N1S27]|uniref:hypothetical protein n=1 Tax=Kocuria kalidii TaxID=3376283 RepID=UPI0037B88F5F